MVTFRYWRCWPCWYCHSVVFFTRSTRRQAFTPSPCALSLSRELFCGGLNKVGWVVQAAQEAAISVSIPLLSTAACCQSTHEQAVLQHVEHLMLQMDILLQFLSLLLLLLLSLLLLLPANAGW
jgi:hypothetical protein